jgi:hypothetical protein
MEPKRKKVRFSTEAPEVFQDSTDEEILSGSEEDERAIAERLTDKDVHIVKDKNNGQLYLTLKDHDGKYIMLKRQAGKKKRGYLPVWWKWKDASNKKRGFTERTQGEAPGEEWEIWKCSPEAVEVVENRGNVLSEKFLLLPEEDQNFLELRGGELE